MTRTHRPLPTEVKQLDAAHGTFSGLGAVFGNLDYNGDIIDRGAFVETLRDLKAAQAKTGSPYLVPLLWMHDKGMPVGGVTDAYETAEGLAITGQCDLNTQGGQAAFSGVKLGYANGLSIGFLTNRATSDANGVRHLTSIRLLEISVITLGFAANPLALADSLSAKSRKDTNMNHNDNAFKRAFLAGLHESARRAELASVVSAPEHKDFNNDREYAEAFRAWQRKTSSVPLPNESVRTAEKGTAREHEAGYMAITQSMEEIQVELARQQDQRATQPNAPLDDVRAYAKRHGRTPDGRAVPSSDQIDVDTYNRSLRERLNRIK